MKISVTSRWYVFPAAMLMLAHAAPVYAETLQDAVRSAIETNPSIEGAQADSQAAGQDSREQRSNYYPHISASMTGGRMYGDNATSRGLSITRGAGYSGLWDNSVSAKEKIFDGFETTNRVRAATSHQMSADLNLADVRENIAYKTTQAYIDLMRARQGLAMLNAYGRKVDDYLGRIKKMMDGGAADEAMHQQARDIRVILDGLVADYEGQVRAAESNYYDLTGHAADATLVKPTPAADFPANIQDALNYTKASNPGVKAAQYESESATYDAAAEKGPLYPSLEGELSYLRESKAELIGGDVKDERAVMHLNWDFDTGGAQLARISKKAYAKQEALSKAREAEKRAELGVHLAYSEYETAQRQLENGKKRRELNETLFKTYQNQFQGSKITLLQLMQADNQLFTTGLEKMNSEYRLTLAQFAILASMGRLQESIGQVAMSDARPVNVPAAPEAPKSTPAPMTGFVSAPAK